MGKFLRWVEMQKVGWAFSPTKNEGWGRNPNLQTMVKENLDGLDKLLNFYFDKKDSMKPLPKLLDGLEILKIKNIKQGPILGEIIDALKEAQISGEVNTKEEAVEFVLNYKI